MDELHSVKLDDLFAALNYTFNSGREVTADNEKKFRYVLAYDTGKNYAMYDASYWYKGRHYCIFQLQYELGKSFEWVAGNASYDNFIDSCYKNTLQRLLLSKDADITTPNGSSILVKSARTIYDE